MSSAAASSTEALHMEMETEPGPGGDASSKRTNVLKSEQSPQKEKSVNLDEGSPSKPTEVANQPDEEAHSKAGSETDLDSLSTRDVGSPLTVASIPASEMITKTVLEEENKLVKLEEQVEKEQEAELNKRKELWSHMDNETKEMRYKRLQCLLMKSNMYTDYVLKRMERQKEEEKKRRERLLKKIAKEEKAKEQEKMKKQEDDSCAEETMKVDPPTVEETKTANHEESTVENIQRSPSAAANSQCDNSEATGTRTRRSKTSLRAPVHKSKLSASNSPVLSQLNTPSRTPNTAIVGGATPKVDSASSVCDSTSKATFPSSAESADETDSPDSMKENLPSRKSSRIRTSLAPPPVQDFEECIREYLGEKLIPRTEESQEPDQASEDPLYSASKRGRKRKNQDYSEQSPQSAKLLTHFFKPSSKRRKLDEDSEDENEATKDAEDSDNPDTHPSAELETGPKKVSKKEPDFEGEPEIEDDGTIVRPALFTGGELRRYQVDGLNWLKVLFENGVNGILADEMGLGKTIQVIALITQIVTMGATGPFMVVAPLSTLPNWKSEFKRFASRLPVVFYHGSKDDRAEIRKQIRKRHHIMKNVTIQPIVITSYEMAMTDRPFLKNHEWTYMIVDEGHRIKNKNCRLIRELKLYKTSHRLLLTGTPLQNSLRELWSLLNFLLPEIFDDLGSFETWFDVEIISDVGADEAIIREEQKSNILGMLHQILTPFMLRRIKSDVDLKIPPKKELLVYAPLTSFQQNFYESTVDRTILQKIEKKNHPEEAAAELSSTGRPKRWVTKKKVDYKLMMASDQDTDEVKNKKKEEEELESWITAVVENSQPLKREEDKVKKSQVTIRLQNIMMQLRKVCNHPYLLEYPLDKSGEYKMDEDLVNTCGKMMILDRMLAELKKRGHKVLIFSQMTKMLDILEDYLLLRKMKYCRLDGSCGIEDRQQSMESFNQESDMFIFLLSTRAGGLGINLVAADTVIIYDSDWNPQNDLQAQDRCHRIGQTRPVMVYRFVTANTIDQKIVERAAAKRKLEKMIIHKGKFKSGIRNFSTDMKPLRPEELMELLKSRDYSESVNQGSEGVISKHDLDSLLDRSDMIAAFEKIKQGEKENSEELEEAVLRTTVKESSKLFQVVDFDIGGTTQEEKKEGETILFKSMEATPDNLGTEIKEEKMSKQVKEEKMTKQVKEEKMTKQVKEEKMTKQVKEEKMTKQVKEEKMTKQVKEEKMTKQVKEEETTKQVKEEKMTKQIEQEKMTKPIKEEKMQS